jgi:hypothetical protein
MTVSGRSTLSGPPAKGQYLTNRRNRESKEPLLEGKPPTLFHTIILLDAVFLAALSFWLYSEICGRNPLQMSLDERETVSAAHCGLAGEPADSCGRLLD